VVGELLEPATGADAGLQAVTSIVKIATLGAHSVTRI
jgi:hypothetical protein